MNSPYTPWQTCIAPMLDWTDKHYRYLMRQITSHTRLYTEMIAANALLHNQAERYLRFDPVEKPLALQLGGSDPAVLAYCAKLAEKRGYDEVNLNVGCPSKRAQQGHFGACLMQQKQQLADCIKAMRDACGIEVTIKHRIGIDETISYDFLSDFVGNMTLAGCRVFIVHARNALLKGLSPKKNRTIPPLSYQTVHRLKNDYPHCGIIINGGIQTIDGVCEQLKQVDGVMIGREAYHNPYRWIEIDRLLYGERSEPLDRNSIVLKMLSYAEQELSRQDGTTLRTIVRPLLNLYHGQKGSRLWRRMLSDSPELKQNNTQLLINAIETLKKSRFISE